MCLVKGKVYKGITQLWEDCVCKKGELKEWHKCACFLGECQNYGVHKLPLCPIEVIGNLDYKVSWTCFETGVVGQSDDGQPRKRIREVFKETSTIEFLTYLKLNLQTFIKCNFVVRSQNT
jgi:hypothetical protein